MEQWGVATRGRWGVRHHVLPLPVANWFSSQKKCEKRDFSSTFLTLLFQAVFESAFLLLPPSEMDVWSKSTLSVMIHLQGPHRLAAVWTLSCLQSCREKAILGSAQWSQALPPSLLWCPLNYISFSLQPPTPLSLADLSASFFIFAHKRLQLAVSQGGRCCDVSVGTPANKPTSSCVWEPPEQHRPLCCPPPSSPPPP